uniref:Uncharacterized protein n=1 Tax=Rhizophora mucronata TaxID=61149 RepID=A0A2P2LFH2_RHIMU
MPMPPTEKPAEEEE